ncbi:hypothetical protein [Streptomyces thermolilacinus]|uniref:hypothetical protein n=1 Tax=Streptomyces thermolilacinus TaxID=285540 RepID=UPI001112CB75|nr:hypothetical protein [Streptomyces thermolilacinus]
MARGTGVHGERAVTGTFARGARFRERGAGGLPASRPLEGGAVGAQGLRLVREGGDGVLDGRVRDTHVYGLGTERDRQGPEPAA